MNKSKRQSTPYKRGLRCHHCGETYYQSKGLGLCPTCYEIPEARNKYRLVPQAWHGPIVKYVATRDPIREEWTMGLHTGIEYCDSTLNLQMGCAGCELWQPAKGVKRCYAGRLTERYAGVNRGFPAAFTDPAIFDSRMATAEAWPDLTGKDRPDKPWLNGYPRIIFLNDMGDTFTPGLPDDWLAPFLPRIARTPHIYLILTKWPARMARFSQLYPFPRNVWAGTSVTGQPTLSRLEKLVSEVRASTLWASFEPLLEEVVIPERLVSLATGRLHWVVTGGQSGDGADSVPAPEQWFIDLGVQTRHMLAAWFHKQNGEWISNPYGTIFTNHGRPAPSQTVDGQEMIWVGKKDAGALLGGVHYSQMPHWSKEGSHHAYVKPEASSSRRAGLFD